MPRTIALSLLALSSCHAPMVIAERSSDGQVFTTRQGEDDDLMGVTLQKALKASAAHDIPCPRDSVRVLQDGEQLVLEGCGERVTYVQGCKTEKTRIVCDYLLTARVRVP